MPDPRPAESLLTDLAAALAAGSVRVIDLTMPLGPETPVLPLPDPWPNSPTFEMSEISRYDERGPAWYWNSFVTDATSCARRGTDVGRRRTGRAGGRLTGARPDRTDALTLGRPGEGACLHRHSGDRPGDEMGTGDVVAAQASRVPAER